MFVLYWRALFRRRTRTGSGWWRWGPLGRGRFPPPRRRPTTSPSTIQADIHHRLGYGWVGGRGIFFGQMHIKPQNMETYRNPGGGGCRLPLPPCSPMDKYVKTATILVENILADFFYLFYIHCKFLYCIFFHLPSPLQFNWVIFYFLKRETCCLRNTSFNLFCLFLNVISFKYRHHSILERLQNMDIHFKLGT